MQRWRVIISLMLFSFELQEGWEGFYSEEGGKSVRTIMTPLLVIFLLIGLKLIITAN